MSHYSVITRKNDAALRRQMEEFVAILEASAQGGLAAAVRAEPGGACPAEPPAIKRFGVTRRFHTFAGTSGVR